MISEERIKYYDVCFVLFTFKYLFEQLLEHENEINEELLQSLAPWSDSIPEELRATI